MTNNGIRKNISILSRIIKLGGYNNSISTVLFIISFNKNINLFLFSQFICSRPVNFNNFIYTCCLHQVCQPLRRNYLEKLSFRHIIYQSVGNPLPHPVNFFFFRIIFEIEYTKNQFSFP